MEVGGLVLLECCVMRKLEIQPSETIRDQLFGSVMRAFCCDVLLNS
jgi:hypothetical protein